MITGSRFGGMGVDLMGRRNHRFFLGGREGGVARCWAVRKEKSPDFSSREVGISEIYSKEQFGC